MSSKPACLRIVPPTELTANTTEQFSQQIQGLVHFRCNQIKKKKKKGCSLVNFRHILSEESKLAHRQSNYVAQSSVQSVV